MSIDCEICNYSASSEAELEDHLKFAAKHEAIHLFRSSHMDMKLDRMFDGTNIKPLARGEIQFIVKECLALPQMKIWLKHIRDSTFDSNVRDAMNEALELQPIQNDNCGNILAKP